jgi:hypothetical protein
MFCIHYVGPSGALLRVGSLGEIPVGDGRSRRICSLELIVWKFDVVAQVPADDEVRYKWNLYQPGNKVAKAMPKVVFGANAGANLTAECCFLSRKGVISA